MKGKQKRKNKKRKKKKTTTKTKTKTHTAGGGEEEEEHAQQETSSPHPLVGLPVPHTLLWGVVPNPSRPPATHCGVHSPCRAHLWGTLRHLT